MIVNMIMKREKRSNGGSQDESRERKEERREKREERRVKIQEDRYDNGGNVIVCISLPSFSYNIEMV